MAPVAQRARGTQDILPADQPYWALMERVAQEVAGRAGYQRIETPIFEPTELFVRSAGEGSDVVTKEMYTFRDRGDRSLTLRPEGTAAIVRAYFDAGLDQEPQPVRLFYLGPFFRYDRPQAGHSVMEQGLLRHQRKKLLGLLRCAERPESRTGTTGQNHSPAAHSPIIPASSGAPVRRATSA